MRCLCSLHGQAPPPLISSMYTTIASLPAATKSARIHVVSAAAKVNTCEMCDVSARFIARAINIFSFHFAHDDNDFAARFVRYTYANISNKKAAVLCSIFQF